MAQFLRSVWFGLELPKDFSCDVIWLTKFLANILTKHLFIANSFCKWQLINVEFDFIFFIQLVKRQLLQLFMRVWHNCMLLAECSLQAV